MYPLISMTLKGFALELHISPIRDIQTICKTLYGSKIDINVWSISGHNHLIGNPPGNVDVINQKTWKDIDEKMVDAFIVRYSGVLVKYDFFVVCHSPVFAILFARFGKPILVYNTCRYDQPFCWNKKPNRLNESLKLMVETKQLTIVSNNHNDYWYLRNKTGLESYIIPSICLYTGVKYRPNKLQAVCFGNRGLFPEGDWLVPKPENYAYSELFSYKAIVHVPYEMSTMSIAEQFWAGVPLFFPTKKFYKQCVIEGKMQFISLYGQETLVKDLDEWVDRADFYIFPFIHYYDSFEHCQRLIEQFNDNLYDQRFKYIHENKMKILEAWNRVLPFRK